MVFPTIGIMLASILFWIAAGLITIGLAGYVAGPATATFLAFVGIRSALSSQERLQSPDLTLMVVYSFAYGVILTIGQTALVLLADVIAILAPPHRRHLRSPVQKWSRKTSAPCARRTDNAFSL